jgi:hypothetical protein
MEKQEQQSKTEKNEICCKVEKTDSRTWKLEISDARDSVTAEINLTDRILGFDYFTKSQEGKPENSDSVSFGFDRQKNNIDVTYRGKNGEGSREVLVGIPISTLQVSLRTKEIENLKVPEKTEETKPEKEVKEEEKTPLKEISYETKTSEKYIGRIKESLDKSGNVRESSLFNVFKTGGQRIGLKAYLRHLEDRGLVQVSSDDQGPIYHFTKPINYEHREKQKRKTEKGFNKTEYPTRLKEMLKDNRISIGDIDSSCKSGPERRSIKMFISKNYVEKGLAEKVDDPKGPFYQFKSPDSLKAN